RFSPRNTGCYRRALLSLAAMRPRSINFSVIRMLGAVLAIGLLLPTTFVAAQIEEPSEEPAQQPAQQDQRSAVTNPIELRTEIFIVSLVTLDDGTREERFTEATSAIP